MVQKSKISLLLLQLNLIAEIGPATIAKLITKLGTDRLIDLYQATQADLLALGLSLDKAQRILAGLKSTVVLEQELALINKYQVQWTTILDQDYPDSLRNIQGAPIILYWRGNLLQWPTQALAVVGSRAANAYAQTVVDQIVPQLVQAGYTIVSGGALGVDAMAHRAALKAGGQTIVVCGTGLAHVYPAQHAKLYQQIINDHGLIVSSFSMNTIGLPSNFVARNRLVSGLSVGCLVVQAALQSGAKITAQFALEQGRELFVVPGLFGDKLSAGCHQLAQEGAKVIHDVNDILNEFSFTNHVSIAKKITNTDDIIIDLCLQPISFDGLLNQINLSTLDLQMRLFDLQLQGKVKQNFTGLWEKG